MARGLTNHTFATNVRAFWTRDILICTPLDARADAKHQTLQVDWDGFLLFFLVVSHFQVRGDYGEVRTKPGRSTPPLPLIQPNEHELELRCTGSACSGTTHNCVVARNY